MAPAPVGAEYPLVVIESRRAWREWLVEHHATAAGAWAVTSKVASGGPSVPYDEVVEEALCFGWIDGVRRALDDRRTRVLVTPRRRRSN